MFDTSAKQRTPSYTDRILYKCGKQQVLPSPTGIFLNLLTSYFIFIIIVFNYSL